MKRFIHKVILFLGIIVVVNTSFFVFIKVNYLTEYNLPEKRLSNVLLADSHGLPLGDLSTYGVTNLSTASDSYRDMRRKLEYLNDRAQLDTVFISVDGHTLSFYRELLNNTDRSIIYASAEEFVSPFEYLENRVVRYYCVFFNSKYSEFFKQYVKGKLRKSKTNVDEWALLSESDRETRAQVRFDKQFGDSFQSERMLKELNAMIQLCDRKGIVLIGVKFPLSPIYNDLVGDLSYGADSVFQNQGLEVRDFQRDAHFDVHSFKNQDHLNDAGGRIFANLLFRHEKKGVTCFR